MATYQGLKQVNDGANECKLVVWALGLPLVCPSKGNVEQR